MEKTYTQKISADLELWQVVSFLIQNISLNPAHSMSVTNDA